MEKGDGGERQPLHRSHSPSSTHLDFRPAARVQLPFQLSACAIECGALAGGVGFQGQCVRDMQGAMGASPDSDPSLLPVQCVELPLILRQRAMVMLRKAAGKERLGIKKMVAKHRPLRSHEEAGLPFTRAMYTGERTPAGDAGAGLTLLADRLPAFYASALRPLIELRKRLPDFVPQRVLLHGAGMGCAAFAVRHAWPDHRPEVFAPSGRHARRPAPVCEVTCPSPHAQIVAVEAHAELAKIGQELTSGMAGLTWQAQAHAPASSHRAKSSAPDTSSGTDANKGTRRGTVYGELDLGSYSPKERRGAEDGELDVHANNPYARPLDPDRGVRQSQSGALPSASRAADAEEESIVLLDVVGGSGMDEDRGVDQVDGKKSLGTAPATSQASQGRGWDLILCSFSFAEKTVAGGGDHASVRHLEEVLVSCCSEPCCLRRVVSWQAFLLPTLVSNTRLQARRLWRDCSGAMVVVEAGTPTGFAHVERVRALLLEKDGSDCTVVAPCPHDGPCPLAGRSLSSHPALLRGDEQTARSSGGSVRSAKEQERAAAATTKAGGGSQSSNAASWCHFSQRISVPSFQKAAEGGARAKKRAFVDWKFSFVALSRKQLVSLAPPGADPGEGAVDGNDARSGRELTQEQGASLFPGGGGAEGAALSAQSQGDAAPVNWGRVLRWPMKRSGHVILDLCSARGGLERRVIAKSHGAAGGYRRARELVWGDVFPYNKLDKKDREARKRPHASTQT